MSLLDDVSIVVTPNGYKAGELYAVIPVPTEGAEMLSQPVDLVTDFLVNSGGVIVDADTFTTAGGTFDGIRINSFFTIGTRYKLIIDGDTTSSGFTIGETTLSGNEYGSGFGTHYFTAIGTGSLWIRQQTSGTTNITSFSIKEYTSADMDVTRNTAATRVDENGLVNYAEVLGGEEVTNGDFTQLPLGTSWDAYTSGSSTVAFTEGAILSIDGSNSNVGVYQQNIFTNGVQYKIVVSVKATASFDAEIVESQGAATQTTIGTVSLTTSYQDFVFYFTGTGTNDLFIHRLYGETAGQNQQIYIKEVSVKEVTRDNVPRIDYTGGGCPHILAEPMRTNNLTASQDLTDSFWNSISTVTIVASTVLSPDGTTFGFKAIPYSGNTTHYVDYDYGFLSMPIGEVTYSIFVKPFGYTNFQLAPSSGMNSRYQNFELTGDGVLGAGDVNGAKIEKIGDWYRCSITETSVSASPRVLNIATPTSGLGRNPTFTGNGTDGVLLWGGQIEEGTYGTSYIPNLSTTSGSTVTRNQDIFTRDGIGSLIGQTEGTFFIELSKPVLNFSTQSLISLNNAASNSDANSIAIGFDAGDDFFIRLQSNNVLVFQETETNADANTFYKVAISYKSGESLMYLNGSPLTPTSGNLSNTFTFAVILDNLSFDFRGDGALPFFGKVKQLQVYDTALTDEQLLQLTGESGTDFYESYAEMASALTYTIQ